MRSKTTLDIKQELALKQGKAYEDALNYMKGLTNASSTETGDYIVTFAAEGAEGMYLMQRNLGLRWIIPNEKENQHLEIAVQDKLDLRFIPELDVKIFLKDKNRKIVSSKKLPFLWHPFLYHYGANVSIPKEGKYDVRVFISGAKFGRHDENKGRKYEKDIKVSIGSVFLKPGKKEYGPE